MKSYQTKTDFKKQETKFLRSSLVNFAVNNVKIRGSTSLQQLKERLLNGATPELNFVVTTLTGSKFKAASTSSKISRFGSPNISLEIKIWSSQV